MRFFFGVWLLEFVDIFYSLLNVLSFVDNIKIFVFGLEIIYFFFVFERFGEIFFLIFEWEWKDRLSGFVRVVIGVKKFYFGVGGLLDDFVEKMRGFGIIVNNLFEECIGVVRGVVDC